MPFNQIFMKSGKSFSSRKSGGAGRGRSGGAKKLVGKRTTGSAKFSSSRTGSKPYGKRDDRDEKSSRERSSSFERSDERSDFKKPFDKKFSSRSKPFNKRDERDEKPSRERSSSFERSDEKIDFKKPYDKKFSGKTKPFGKRDDREEKPYGDRSKPFRHSDDRKETGSRKTFDKKFTGSAKPFVKRDDRDERPARGRASSFERSDERNDFKKPYEKKFTSRAKPFGKRNDRDEKPFSDRSRSYQKSDDSSAFKKTYGKKSPASEKPYSKRDDRDESRDDDRSKPFRKSSDKNGFDSPRAGDRIIRGKSKPIGKRDDNDEKVKNEHSETFHPTEDGKDFVKSDKIAAKRPKRKRKEEDIPELTNESNDSQVNDRSDFKERKTAKRNSEESSSKDSGQPWNRKSGHEFFGDKKKSLGRKRNDRKEQSEYKKDDDGSIRLNKYISNSGICSRREADELIEAGVISVNGEIMTLLGYKVKQDDVVKYNNETLRAEKLVYILVNKPKDFITTVDDPQDRKTVMWLIKDACRERVYPVGRLDRNTTGVLLFTNDGELAKKLTHPSFEVQKIYQVDLDAPLKPSDMAEISNGLTMEDGYIKVDDIAYAGSGQDTSVVGVELHSGKNRIVRRIFEHFGYYIKKLDRVYFAGLSKKDLPRGRWRFLSPIEVSNLKMMTGNKKMQKYYEA